MVSSDVHIILINLTLNFNILCCSSCTPLLPVRTDAEVINTWSAKLITKNYNTTIPQLKNEYDYELNTN